MASSSTQTSGTVDKSILTPVITLEGHEPWKLSLPDGKHYELKDVSCMSYFPDGKQMISGSRDKTIRRWDLRKGKEIEEAREVCEDVQAVGVSRDGRRVITAGRMSLKVSEVETGIVRTFDEDNLISCIDISADSTLLAGASYQGVRIWNLDTGELVAGPFKIGDIIPAGPFKIGDYFPGALRFSEDSRKLAVSSYLKERRLQVWDIQTQKLDVQRSSRKDGPTYPVFWTTKDKSIVTAFTLTDDIDDHDYRKIYEFDASTLKTVGAPFKHTYTISGLALSSDCAFLASSSFDCTINLWAFESRQLLASFDVKSTFKIILSPDSRQLACTYRDDAKIYIYDIPANILASIRSTNKSEHFDLLNSDATRRTVCRKPVIIPVTSHIPCPPRPLPKSDPRTFLRSLRKLFSSSFRVDAVRTNDSRNPLDFPATSPLPRSLIKPDENSRPAPAPPTTQSSAINTPPKLTSRLHRLWHLQTNHASPTIVDVPLAPGKLRIATAGALGDDDDLIRDEDYVSPPSSPNPSSRPGIANTGQHGSGRFCFCF